MAIVAAEAPESSSRSGKGALVPHAHAAADTVAPAWFTMFATSNQMGQQASMDKLQVLEQKQDLTNSKMEEMQARQSKWCFIELKRQTLAMQKFCMLNMLDLAGRQW